ncbi:DUF4957 domain-containing protein [Bacteroides sp. 214]|uniref:DUF4992 family lipoprotein n=1 Tax=Bacteroides sp. 214 TaxID=2302935 RepID=UPI0013CFED49|nr:DUF4992 family lipoprotein [Bacteroides sp. 214]NDW12203.1 DUF4957 domain-containing protein [Bacteroides sp. 214]
MKMNYLFLSGNRQIGKWAAACCLCLFLVGVTSCQHGLDDSERFSGGVTGVTLESPNPSEVTFTKVAGTSNVKIEWPVVYGAGGYAFSLYIVDDPDNPELVGEENEFVDGISIIREYKEDTKYMANITALGNEKLNNKDAAPSEVSWSTLLAATMVPDGLDLTTYFADFEDPGEEVAYELAPNGNYTVSGEINFGTANVTLRGNKLSPATVVLSAGFKSQGGGNNFKFINFKCEGLTGSKSFYGFNAIPEGAALVSNGYIVKNPIVIQSCSFEKLPVHLFFDDGKHYAVSVFLVDNCVVELTNNGRFYQNSGSNGGVSNFTISNSTVYKNNQGKDYFMQLSGQRPHQLGWTSAGQTYRNCTFYQFDRMHNSNNYSRNELNCYTTVENCIFLDGLRDAAARYILPSNNVNNKTLTFKNNTYWRNGAAETGNGNYDKSGTSLDEDPGCKDPSSGDFTVTNPNTIARRIGDPRWFE